MKHLSLAALLLAAAPALAQTTTPAAPAPATPAAGTMAEPEKKMPEDKSKRPSPPAVAKADVRGTEVAIDYSRPSLKSRAVFGEKSPLAPVGEVWRTGANEATTFTVSKPVKINGQPLAAGTYGLFTIPGPSEWTIIFNKTAKQWGAYEYKAADDVLRVKAKPKQVTTSAEQFTINVDKSGKVAMLWGTTEVDFQVK